MGSVYTKRFAAGIASTGVTSVFTVPADGKTYVLRDIELASNAAGTTLVILDINGNVYLETFLPTAQFQTRSRECRVVLEAGDVLELSCVGGGATYALTGYQLD